jgi:hypothetical protein
MDANKRIEALETQVTALQEWLSIVLLVLAKSEPASQTAPPQEAEPQVITDLAQINFPI